MRFKSFFEVSSDFCLVDKKWVWNTLILYKSKQKWLALLIIFQVISIPWLLSLCGLAIIYDNSRAVANLCFSTAGWIMTYWCQILLFFLNTDEMNKSYCVFLLLLIQQILHEREVSANIIVLKILNLLQVGNNNEEVGRVWDGIFLRRLLWFYNIDTASCTLWLVKNPWFISI